MANTQSRPTLKAHPRAVKRCSSGFVHSKAPRQPARWACLSWCLPVLFGSSRRFSALVKYSFVAFTSSYTALLWRAAPATFSCGQNNLLKDKIGLPLPLRLNARHEANAIRLRDCQLRAKALSLDSLRWRPQ